MSECLVTKQDALAGVKGFFANKPGIWFVGLINRRGRIVQSSHDNVLSLDSRSQEMFFTEIALQTRMYEDFDEHFDSVQYSLTERGQVKIVIVPMRDHNTVVMVMDRQEDHADVIGRIRAAASASSDILDLNRLMEKEVEL